MSTDSVAARLAAHISTPYIIAQGRHEREPLVVAGVPTDDKFVPLCMLPPSEFRKRMEDHQPPVAAAAGSAVNAAEQHDLSRITALEDGIERINRKLEAASDSVNLEAMKRDVALGLTLNRARLTDRLKQAQDLASQNLQAASATSSREPEDAGTDFIERSRAIARTRELQDREVDVNARRERLAQLRDRARELEVSADQRAELRSQAVIEAKERATAEAQAQLAQIADRERRDRVAAELARVKEERRREQVVDDERRRIATDAAVDVAVWQQRVKHITAQDRAAAELARDKEISLLALQADQAAAAAEERYDMLALLLERYEAHVSELREALARRPSSLMRLVIADAKQRGPAHGAFPGLELLCDATTTPRPETC